MALDMMKRDIADHGTKIKTGWCMVLYRHTPHWLDENPPRYPPYGRK